MFSPEFLHSNLFNWFLLPVLIFLSRTCDVSLATLRNIFIARNIRNIVPLIGFFEVLLWLIAIRTVIGNLNNIACYIGFAAGYANGIYVGLKIEEKLALGKQMVRIFTKADTAPLIHDLYDQGLGVTSIDGNGTQGPVTVLYITLQRKDMQLVHDLINKHVPGSFYTVEDIRNARQGVFRNNKKEGRFSFLRALLPLQS